jgi:hypothetical protein
MGVSLFHPSMRLRLADSVQLRLALYLVDELVVVQGTVIWVSFNGDSSLDIQGVGGSINGLGG